MEPLQSQGRGRVEEGEPWNLIVKNQRSSAEERGHKGRNHKLYNDVNARNSLTNNKHMRTYTTS